MFPKKFSSYWRTVFVTLFIFSIFACETDDGDEIDRTPPTVPGGLKTIDVGDSAIKLKWEPSGDNMAVTKYIVYQNDVQVANDSVVNYLAENLIPETQYTFKIRAVDAAGNISGFTPEVQATTLKKKPQIESVSSDTIAPSVPQNLVASNIGASSATIGWEASSDNSDVVAYKIFRDTVLLATVLKTEFQAAELQPNTEYSFAVLAIDKGDNESALSTPVKVLTLDEDAVSADATAPTAPTDLVASQTTEATISLKWEAATDNVGVAGYRIYQDDILLDSVTETQYQAVDLQAETTYNFTVSAFDSAQNESPVSEAVTAATTLVADIDSPTAPIGLSASNTTQTTTELRWEAASDNTAVTVYSIYQDNSIIATISETSYLVSDLNANTDYQFTVTASDAAGNESLPSAPLSLTTTDFETSAIEKILVFTKTAEFRHASIARGVATLAALGEANNFEIVQTENGNDFTDGILKQYRAVVFLSTTGDVLNNTQQTAFENYIRNGGSFMGIHAATDTEYDWPWYGRLVGAYFDGHPDVQQATLNVVDTNHPATAQLPRPWIRSDEWYNFRNINDNINVLLNLDESSYNGGTNGNNHPHAWYHEFDGGRSFYTAGGHSDANFDEPDFRQHLLGGILYCLGR